MAARPILISLVVLGTVGPLKPGWTSPPSATGPAPHLTVLPTPKQVQARPGRTLLGRRQPAAQPDCCVVAGPEAGFAAEIVAQRLGAPMVAAPRPGCLPVTLRVDARAPFADKLGADARPEAYQLNVESQGVQIVAVEPEGLLRAAATLLQILQEENGAFYASQVSITDWPNFRYRCASDWLLNAEINRWAYDWGDGRKPFIARVKRKLDLCFAYKINQVWFDGFGWDINRCEQYAETMRECTQYARRRGVKLTFAGYGGGYGTSYQTSELYRCGYFGQTFFNRRPYPDGAEYFCRGMGRNEQSRRYGTCLANTGLQQAKLEEMQRFAAAVEPGFMYIHDTDSGTFAESQASWRLRCDECRRRWPSDELADPQGQAGALAAWYRQIHDALRTVATANGYQARRDLTLIFISPLYTEYYEKGPPDLWQREVDYFRVLARQLGPAESVQFGLREQFFRPGGGKKIAHLRETLDKTGAGVRPHVVAFGGGDNYLSDDLANVSGAMAHFYEGAASVCLSNGGVHEEPIQLLNAEFLWAGRAGGYRAEPSDEAAAQALFRRMAVGKHRPEQIFAAGQVFERVCCRLWGPAAGKEMCLAYLTPGETGDGPVSRVWWAVTSEVARLQPSSSPSRVQWDEQHARWRRRLAVTERALVHARRAAALTDHEDVQWFAHCLEVGARFAECAALSCQLRGGDDAAVRARLARLLSELQSQIAAAGWQDKTDLLGGDPGCWLETIANLRKVNGL